jgi:hypothetical protein
VTDVLGFEVLRRLRRKDKGRLRTVSRAAREFVDSHCVALKVHISDREAHSVAAAAAAGRLPSLRKLTLRMDEPLPDTPGVWGGLAGLTQLRAYQKGYFSYTAGLASLAAGLPQLRRLVVSGMRHARLPQGHWSCLEVRSPQSSAGPCALHDVPFRHLLPARAGDLLSTHCADYPFASQQHNLHNHHTPRTQPSQLSAARS